MSPGNTHIGRYEILGLIGAGGMGEVYRARDTTLDRIVALKLISEKLLADPLAIRRFQREARSASALNHPHICTIYDVGDWDGRPFIAMEYLEGASLRRRLDAGPLKLVELVRFAIDIAEALEAAHAQEIVHRDIKPANLFVTRQADVKILDFGLAKRAVAKAKSKLAGGDETETADENALSHPGLVGGTVNYMSPEQARGEELDARSDLFSFGLVLYEMATGKLAFDGDTQATIFAALLTAQPKPASEQNPAMPARLDEIISKALEKDRELRYQHASDMRADLKRLLRSIESDPRIAPPGVKLPTQSRAPRKWILLTAALFLLCLTAAVFFFRHASLRPANLKPRQITSYSSERPVATACISPDGKYVSYQMKGEINIRLIATGDVRTLKHPVSFTDQDEWWPVAWSPDGARLIANSIGARPNGMRAGIWGISVLTGAAIELRQGALASALSRDGSQIAMLTGGNDLNSEIWVMGSQGEDARKIAAAAANENSYYSRADWLPSGQRILAQKIHQAQSATEISVESIDINGGKPTTAVHDASKWVDFRLLPEDRMLYIAREPASNAADTNLWISPTDPKTGAPTGQPRRLSDLAGFWIAI